MERVGVRIQNPMISLAISALHFPLTYLETLPDYKNNDNKSQVWPNNNHNNSSCWQGLFTVVTGIWSWLQDMRVVDSHYPMHEQKRIFNITYSNGLIYLVRHMYLFQSNSIPPCRPKLTNPDPCPHMSPGSPPREAVDKSIMSFPVCHNQGFSLNFFKDG